MDYARLLRFHRSHRAAITVAVKPVPKKDTSRFGILRQAPDGRITDFAEKPGDTDQLPQLVSAKDPQLPFLASMGIYVFKPRILYELLDSEFVDFGRHVIPAAIKSHNVYGYRFEYYWEDIGTVRSFYDASLALVQSEPPFTFNDTLWPVYTRPRFLPGCRLYDVKCDRALLTDGCIINQAEIYNSLIGNRSVIGPKVVIRDTVLMGAGRYESETEPRVSGVPAIGIGEGSHITGTIIDRDARIGAGVRIERFPPGTDIDEESWSVRDGIVVVPHHAVIAEGAIIAP